LLSAAELGAQLHDDEIATAPARIEWLLAQGADPGSAMPVATPHCSPCSTAARRRCRPCGPCWGAHIPVRRWRPGALPGRLRGGDAAAPGLEACALELLERGADPFAASKAGDPPLALAVRLAGRAWSNACSPSGCRWIPATATA